MTQAAFLRQEAQAAYAAADYPRAEELYTRFLALEPTDPEALLRRGLCRGWQGTPEPSRIREAAAGGCEALAALGALQGADPAFFAFAGQALEEMKRCFGDCAKRLEANRTHWTNNAFDLTPEILAQEGYLSLAEGGRAVLETLLAQTEDFSGGDAGFFRALLAFSRETLARFTGDYPALAALAAPILTRTAQRGLPEAREGCQALAALLWQAPCLEDSPERRESIRRLLEDCGVDPEEPVPPAAEHTSHRRTVIFFAVALAIMVMALVWIGLTR